MINVSMEFKKLLQNDNRNYFEYVNITFTDGTKMNITNDDILFNGLKIEEAVSSDNSFDIGAAIINKCTIILNNIYDNFSKYDFDKAKIFVQIGLPLDNGTIEVLNKGYYTVDNTQYNGSNITLECLDDMQLFDKPYSLSKLEYPATLLQILQDACSICGVLLGTSSFENDNFVVNKRPLDESLTFRQVLLWVSQIACKWCSIDKTERLVLKWYDTSVFENEVKVSGGKFDNSIGKYETGDNINGGYFNPWNVGDIINGGSFKDWRKCHYIRSLNSFSCATDDIVITGIKVIEEVEDKDESKDYSYQFGEKGYMLSVSGNKLIQEGTGQKIADFIGQKMVGIRFRPLTLTCSNDPTIEAGDCAYIIDSKDNIYQCFITNTNFSPGNWQEVSCGAESPSKNSSTRYSVSTQLYVEARKEIASEKTERKKAIENLANRLANSSGLYITTEPQLDGSNIYYMHNKSTLQDSDIVWKLTAEAFGISTDGGKTYPYGFSVTGELITRLLYAEGIDANYINTGTLTARDKAGNIKFQVNIDTGQVIINADDIKIKSESITTDSKLNSSISQTQSGILTTVSANYTTKAETNVVNQNLSVVQQTANKINWLVKSGTSESNFQLTDRTATLVANQINLNGLVSFSGLGSDAQNKINTANSTANSAKAAIESWTSDSNTTLINGGKIYTGSITADKLNIKDLSALNSTIGGFKITDSAIYYDAPDTIGMFVESNNYQYFFAGNRSKDGGTKIDSNGRITLQHNYNTGYDSNILIENYNNTGIAILTSGSLGTGIEIYAGSGTGLKISCDYNANAIKVLFGKTSLRDTIVDGYLTVSDNTKISGTLTVSNNATIGDTLTVTKNAEIGGTLTVSGQTTINSNLTVNGELSVKYNTTIKGTLTIDGYYSSTLRDTYIKGDLRVGTTNNDILSFFGTSGSSRKSVSLITSPSSATASTVASKVNDLINALKAYGLIS